MSKKQKAKAGHVRASHILVPKLSLAQDIKKQLSSGVSFNQLAQKFYVMGVPKTVINEGVIQFEGAYPEDNFVEKILEAYKKA